MNAFAVHHQRRGSISTAPARGRIFRFGLARLALTSVSALSRLYNRCARSRLRRALGLHLQLRMSSFELRSRPSSTAHLARWFTGECYRLHRGAPSPSESPPPVSCRSRPSPVTDRNVDNTLPRALFAAIASSIVASRSNVTFASRGPRFQRPVPWSTLSGRSAGRGTSRALSRRSASSRLRPPTAPTSRRPARRGRSCRACCGRRPTAPPQR